MKILLPKVTGFVLGIFLVAIILVAGCGEGAKSDRFVLGPPPETGNKTWSLSLTQVQNAITNATNTPWTAGETYVTKNINQADAKVLCGWTDSFPSTARRSVAERIDEDVSLPARFSWREKNGVNWLSAVKNQGPYGTSVPFAACGAFEAMINISMASPSTNTDLSEWYLWFKGTGGKNPNPGGWSAIQASEYLKNFGVVQEGYAVYSALPRFTEPLSSIARTKLTSYRTVQGAAAMKQALINGPLVGGMTVYTDFFYYKGGIYRHVAGSAEGGHAVLIVGFDDTYKYWICKNSWSTDWGENGFFNIVYDELKTVAYSYSYTSTDGAPVNATNNAPSTPVIVNPKNGDTAVLLNPAIWANSFNDTDSGDFHAKTDWEIYTASTTNPALRVWFRSGETASKTIILVDGSNGAFENALSGKTALATSTQYWARVRYFDTRGAASEWSAFSRFTTLSESSASPNQPTIFSPKAGDFAVDVNPLLSATPFSDNNAGEVHLKTDWEIFSDAGLASSTRVWFRLGEPAYLTAIRVDGSNGTFENPLVGQTQLAYFNQYWVRVRYYDQSGLYSPWSEAIFFTTTQSAK